MQETLYLWWLDPHTQKRYPAGVAFHEDEYGEYRLKIDLLDQNRYYLKTTTLENDELKYRVEAVEKRDGRFFRRKAVGEAKSWPTKNRDEIWIHLWALERPLILTLKRK